jgi:probable rRNA maturation factor
VSIVVEVSDTQGHHRCDHSALIRLVQSVLIAERRADASISIALVDNATIRALNRKHLGHDWPTDVISFPLSAPDEPQLAGEMVVSAEMAVAAAAELAVEPGSELALYVVHGLLHFCGYDDRIEADAALMRKRQDELLGLCGRRL